MDKLLTYFGRKADIARALDVSPQVVNGWFARGMPVKWAVQVERLTRGEVTRQDLRPDIFFPRVNQPSIAQI